MVPAADIDCCYCCYYCCCWAAAAVCDDHLRVLLSHVPPCVELRPLQAIESEVSIPKGGQSSIMIYASHHVLAHTECQSGHTALAQSVQASRYVYRMDVIAGSKCRQYRRELLLLQVFDSGMLRTLATHCPAAAGAPAVMAAAGVVSNILNLGRYANSSDVAAKCSIM